MDTKLLEFGKAKLEAYSKVITSIERGSSEAEACRKYNVGRTAFRNFLRKGYDTSEYYNEYFSWKDKFCNDVLGDGTAVCENFDEAYEYIKSILTEREVKLLEMRYEQGMHFSEIGKEFGVTKERVRQLTNKLIYKLSHSNQARVLKYGVEYISILEKQKQNLAQIKDNLRDAKDPRGILIEDLNLSIRTYNCLKRTGLNTLQEVLDYSNEYGLHKVRWFGWKSYYELNEKAAQFGVTFIYLKE